MSEQTRGEYKMKDQFTPENSALVLIDHQVGTLHFVHQPCLPHESLRNASHARQSCEGLRHACSPYN